MHDHGRGDTVKTIWGLGVFSDPAAGEGETRMAEIMARVMGECAEKMELGAVWAGDYEDGSSEEERGRKRVRRPRSATQWTLAEATCACSCLNPSAMDFTTDDRSEPTGPTIAGSTLAPLESNSTTSRCFRSVFHSPQF